MNGVAGTHNHPLKRGDVIRYGLDSDNCIGEIELVYDSLAGVYYGSSLAVVDFSNRCRFVYGDVQKRDGDYIGIMQAGASELEKFKASSFRIQVYDSKNGGNIYVGSIKDIIDMKSAGSASSRAIVHTRHADARTIIILN